MSLTDSLSTTSSNSVAMKTKEKNSIVVNVIDLISGSMGGCANVLVGQPLDTVKVKLQTFPHLYSNAFVCFRETLAKDGIFKGLYAGSVPALIANVAENSVLFCAYGFCQKTVQYVTGNEKPTLPEKAVCGSMAGFFAAFTLCPTELIKCKLQALRESGNNNKIGPFSLTRSILRAEGIQGLFKGLLPTLSREMPGYFFFFGGYEFTKVFLTNSFKIYGSTSEENSSDVGPIITIMSGGVGGVCFWTAVFPFDVVKSRIQVKSSNTSMMRVLVSIARTEGIAGLYNGLFPTILRSFPSTGALFFAYEYTKTLLTDSAKYCNLL
ncbi:mitochondrial ornithine transporter 1-like protein [Dinothrombium tinctorium]|uniref:Mitochondrial ornithine transporter 1-like protein n=1 Tax=Dinothrombium tinctorium TaxID=1965070 RepID=A0A443RNT9_9ACAR|nr:mitochondrial ornithine transporter 1-like protein [Dinothrombium tinctorium]